MAEYTLPTQYEIKTIKVDGVNIRGLTLGISLFENIYTPSITGVIAMGDTQGMNFLEQYDIQGSEDVEIEIEGANKQDIKFKGHLNGVRNKTHAHQKMVYSLEVMEVVVRENEQGFMTRRFTNKSPEDIVKECLKKLKNPKVDNLSMSGQPMNFLASRWKPFDVIAYVLKHGLTNKSGSSEGKGTNGYMFWQTFIGFRGGSIEEVLKGNLGKDQGKFTYRLGKSGTSLDEQTRSILSYDFKRLGDQFEKMKMGSYKSVQIVFDLDKGEYKELAYVDNQELSDKHKKFLEAPTRYFYRPFSNERLNDECNKAPDNKYDFSNKTLQQTTVANGTFNDKVGELTIPINFQINAGDRIEVVIPKIKSDDTKFEKEDTKFSGKYIVVAVGHHCSITKEAYTKLSIMRADKEHNDTTASKSSGIKSGLVDNPLKDAIYRGNLIKQPFSGFPTGSSNIG